MYNVTCYSRNLFKHPKHLFQTEESTTAHWGESTGSKIKFPSAGGSKLHTNDSKDLNLSTLNIRMAKRPGTPIPQFTTGIWETPLFDNYFTFVNLAAALSKSTEHFRIKSEDKSSLKTKRGQLDI